MMMYIFFILSMIVNIGFGWYVYRLIRTSLGYAGNVHYLINRLDEYREHLDSIHAMNAYHGDEVLEAFVKHTSGICEEIDVFKAAHVLDVVAGEEEWDYEEETKDNA